jgi:hypothetical protein
MHAHDRHGFGRKGSGIVLTPLENLGNATGTAKLYQTRRDGSINSNEQRGRQLNRDIADDSIWAAHPEFD